MEKKPYGQEAWDNYPWGEEMPDSFEDMENFEAFGQEDMEAQKSFSKPPFMGGAAPGQEGFGKPLFDGHVGAAPFGGGKPCHMAHGHLCQKAGCPHGGIGNCICRLIKGCFYLPNLCRIIESHVCNHGVKYIFRQGRWQAILKYTIWLKYISNQNKICWAQRKGCLILADMPCNPSALSNNVVCISQPPCIKRCGSVVKVFDRVIFCRC